MRSEHDEKIVDELSQLVSSACDEVLTESQRVRLNELLGQGAAIRAYYLRLIAIHSALMTTAGKQAIQGVEELRSRLGIVARPAPPSRPKPTPLARFTSPLMRAAMLVFLLVPVAIYFLGSRQATDSGGEARKEATVGAVAHVPWEAPLESLAPNANRLVHVSRVSPQARWQNPNESFTVNSSMRTGNRLNLLEGEIELIYQSGVELLLIGPVEFELRDNGGVLRRGGLMASVPLAGQGFTIETPNGKVVDLGTKFGVMVDDFGVSEVSVFAGKVEAFPTGTGAANEGKIELTKGRALQWSSEMVRSLEADPRRLPFTLASFSHAEVAKISRDATLSNGFQTDTIDPQQWKTLGNIRATSGGLQLDGRLGQTRLPYLVSTEEFDPTRGPITVICDLRFPELDRHDLPSFAILTRSANERTEMNRPWKNVLATCVRCNFRTATDAIDGLLETATKYERDRELTGISWRGFRRPQAGTAYRLVMRDDGVNVSFTVSQLDNPAVSKTVTCRSLFRGYKNHVALEGWDAGVTIVDRVRIFQDAPVGSLASHFPRLPESQEDHTTKNTEEQPNSLIDLVSAGAELIVEDDFDREEVDPRHWKTLGDVVLDKGTVSLGIPSTSGHIDTFHPRPYLLTRRQFTPADGKLYVLGRIKFDENFLQGYGGSFAVMTRCDDQYGAGPDWAISVLGTGVRSNFWPANPRQDHNLDIHEKSAPNTLSFLVGTGLELNPKSRDYYFCLEDDGQRAALTLQDIADHTIRKTLQHTTISPALRSGFVGFESCWGSRVLLDDVRIYVQPRNAVLPEKE